MTKRYDEAERRRSYRKGRERGAWVFVPEAELLRAGFKRGDPPPFYRMWGTARGGLMLRFYRER